ncbi:MAG: MATE family efflux transporter [Pseudomonadota bacterium]
MAALERPTKDARAGSIFNSSEKGLVFAMTAPVDPSPLAGTVDLGHPRPPLDGAGTNWLGTEIRRTVRLAIPLALTQVGLLAMFTVDLMLIGRLGEEALAAGALAHTVMHAALLFAMGIAAAVPPLTAQAVGARDPRMIRRSLRVGLHATTLISLPMIVVQLYSEPLLLMLGQPPATSSAAALYLGSLAWAVLPAAWFVAMRGYMSALDVPNPGLWIMLSGVVLNAGLAYALIFGLPLTPAMTVAGVALPAVAIPSLGLFGAGIATTIVNVLMTAAAAVVILRVPVLANPRPLDNLWRPDWQQFARLLVIGVPIALTFTFEHGLFLASTFMAGAIGTAALASHQIALQVAALAFMIPMGFGLAASVRVGECVGARDLRGAKRAGYVGLTLSIAISMTTTIAVVAFADGLPAAFLGTRASDNDATWTLASVLLIYAAAFFIVDGIQTTLAGVLRGYADTAWPMVFSAVSFWAVGFTVSWYLAFDAELGARGIWIGLIAGLATYATLLFVRFSRKPNR